MCCGSRLTLLFLAFAATSVLAIPAGAVDTHYEIAALAHDEHDRIALADIHERALQLGLSVAHAESFGHADSLAHDWEVRWLDFDGANGHLVRIYHTLNKHDAHLRYTSHSSGHEAPTFDWQPVH